MLICTKRLETPLGFMYGGADQEGVYFIEFIDRVGLNTELKRLCTMLGATMQPGENKHLLTLETELQEYFEGKRKEFSVPLCLSGTDFQISVWNTLISIPYGKTWTYKQQAIKINKLSALRAVAAANGQNKHAIVVPCHRVVGSNGNLTGYAAGLARKQWLLNFESGKAIEAPELPFE